MQTVNKFTYNFTVISKVTSSLKTCPNQSNFQKNSSRSSVE